MKSLRTIAQKINSKRNSIVHQGEFCNEDEAKEIINHAEQFILGLIRLYQPSFQLNKKKL